MTDPPSTVEFEFLDAPVCVLVRPRGVLQAGDGVRWYEAFSSDPRYAQGMPVIFDLAGLDFSATTYATLREYVQRLEELGNERPSQKVALLAPGDLAFGMARIFQTLAEDVPRQRAVFRDLPGALAWIAGPP